MTSRRTGWIAGGVALAIVAALAGLVVWALANRGGGENAVAPAEPPFTRYRAAWTSAMRKAGVDAVFPDAPLDVTKPRAHGRRSFEATFTAEEMTALMAVYPFSTQVGGQDVELRAPVVTFPRAGTASIAATLISDGASHDLRILAPVTFAGGAIESPGPRSLQVDGFSVGGANRRRAGEAAIEYLNLYLKAAPGLTVEEAHIVRGGVAVRGFAAVSLENTQSPQPPGP